MPEAEEHHRLPLLGFDIAQAGDRSPSLPVPLIKQCEA